jgi:hypothetical protein
MTRRRGNHKVEVILPSSSGLRQRRELGAFVRYCVHRIERELGELESWCATITPSCDSNYVSTVEAHHRGQRLVATAYGFDAVLATWNALCQLEQAWRERAPWIAYAS